MLDSPAPNVVSSARNEDIPLWTVRGLSSPATTSTSEKTFHLTTSSPVQCSTSAAMSALPSDTTTTSTSIRNSNSRLLNFVNSISPTWLEGPGHLCPSCHWIQRWRNNSQVVTGTSATTELVFVMPSSPDLPFELVPTPSGSTDTMTRNESASTTNGSKRSISAESYTRSGSWPKIRPPSNLCQGMLSDCSLSPKPKKPRTERDN